MVVWLIGPFLIVVAFMLLSWWRASTQGARLRAARAQGARSDAALSQAMAEAVTRLRGQELAQRAKYEALEAFVAQIAEGVPAGLIVTSPQGHIRLLNQWAAQWLHVPEPVTGRILWNVAGTDALRDLGSECLSSQQRRDGVVASPNAQRGAAGSGLPVTTIPLRSSAGDIDGLLYLINHERVS